MEASKNITINESIRHVADSKKIVRYSIGRNVAIVAIVVVLLGLFIGSLTMILSHKIGINNVDVSSPVIFTKFGPVGGKKSHKGLFIEFLGIPYGKVNASNRFKQAYLPDPWIEVRAPVANVNCPQENVVTLEDCLVVNVNVPMHKHKESLPVMVYIHGGMFLKGGPIPGTNFLMKQDIVLVTLTYRLGVFGFLCLKTPEAPGNTGLKDIVMALQWVKNNIALFGGDPDKVTLFGHSSGSACIDLLLISPMSKGLYSQAILQSGTSLGEWSLTTKPLVPATNLALKLGAKFTDINTLTNVISNSTTRALVIRSPHVLTPDTFAPCIEDRIEGVNSFLTEAPKDILSAGNYSKVPLIVGVTNEEGYAIFEDYDSDILYKNTTGFFELFLHWLNFTSEESKQNCINDIMQFYFQERGINKPDFARFAGDVKYMWPAYVRLKLQHYSQFANAYVYEFDYNGKMNMMKFDKNIWSFEGATHGDELGYLFDWNYSYNEMEQSEKDLYLAKIMCLLWTNFAKYGDPTPEPNPWPIKWLPIQEDQHYCLKIQLPLVMEVGFFENRTSFWDYLYDRYKNKITSK